LAGEVFNLLPSLVSSQATSVVGETPTTAKGVGFVVQCFVISVQTNIGRRGFQSATSAFIRVLIFNPVQQCYHCKVFLPSLVSSQATSAVGETPTTAKGVGFVVQCFVISVQTNIGRRGFQSLTVACVFTSDKRR
jgi:hypothetical protein